MERWIYQRHEKIEKEKVILNYRREGNRMAIDSADVAKASVRLAISTREEENY